MMGSEAGCSVDLSSAAVDSAGSNKTTGTGKDAAKLDRETEETHRKLV